MMAPARRFDNDDEAAQHRLMVLRDGDAAQKCQAREQLAAIFERRGMFEEATDLLVSNVRDGVRNADVFRWLARLYRAQGNEVTAMQAAAEAAKYLPPAAVAPKPAPVPPPMTQTLPSMPVPEPSVPPAAPVVGPPGACLACGYVNRNVRSTCARCHTPLSAGAVAGTPSGVQPAERMSPTTTVGKPRPWYLSTATIILASSLCIPPLALVFVWMRPWRETIKYAVSVPLLLWSIVWVIAVGGAMVRPSSPPSNSVASTAQQAGSASSVAPESLATGQPQQLPTTVPAKPQPTSRPEPTARPTATAVPPTPTPAPPKLIVVNAASQGVALRDAPGTGSQIRLMKDGEILERLGEEEQQAAEKRWWHVRDNEGKDGWTAVSFLLREADVDDRTQFLTYGRSLWRIGRASDRSNTEMFEAMGRASTNAQLAAVLTKASQNAKLQAGLSTEASNVELPDRARKAQQALIDMTNSRRLAAEKIQVAIVSQRPGELDSAKQAVSATQAGTIRFAAEFVFLAFELRVEYETEFKD